MDNKDLFKKYYSRLVREGMLKAFIIGSIVGFAIDFVFSFVTWFFVDYFDWWFLISLLAGLVIGVITTVIVYHKFFKPTTKKIARRIDNLGLEERLITMTELENNESYIAMRQREDARVKMGDVNSKMIKFIVARGLIIAAIVVSVLGLSMTTVNVLTEAGIVEKPQNIINPGNIDANMFLLEYDVEDEIAGEIMFNGEKYGSYTQEVERGQNAKKVTAVAKSGWQFIGWDDGITTPDRIDKDVQGDIFVMALFEEVEADEEGEDGGENEGDSDGDENDDEKDPPNNQNGQPTIGENRYEPSNQVIDGETPYQDVFGEYYDEVIEQLLNNDDCTGEYRAMLEAYFEQLEAGIDPGD